jgi:DNA adenine methylase
MLGLKPFVKWSGGKRQLLTTLKEHLPKNYNRYIEPFVGGGALFFSLAPTDAIITDVNTELINTYGIIYNDVEELITELSSYAYNKDEFYRRRLQLPEELSQVERAARFIYLNRTCFNGLYRENSKGQFNVPFGKYNNPKICDDILLRSISSYLNNNTVRILNQDYTFTLLMASKGDFVYLDPPYHIATKTSFTKYSRSDFREQDQIELSKWFHSLDKRGCKLLLSNSNTELIKNLYKDYTIVPVSATRNINSVGHNRKKGLIEVLVKNY